LITHEFKILLSYMITFSLPKVKQKLGDKDLPKANQKLGDKDLRLAVATKACASSLSWAAINGSYSSR